MQKRADPNEALLRKYPEQVVLVTTRGTDGKANVMAVGWVAIASSVPPMFVLGIDEDAYTYKLLTETREFVVAFPSERMARETLFAGSHSGRDKDKFAEAGIRTEPAALVKAPLVADAVANFECALVEVTKPGDCPLVVGRVLAAHANADASLGRLYSTGKAPELGGVRVVDIGA
jgi:flavin reductase (DIM6/NTAB) family NADH-FMN oxidoreductase RutF